MTELDSRPVRAFLAIEVAPAIHASLVRVKGEFASIRSEVRWVHDDGLHATLKFLGPVAPERLDAVRRAVTPVIRLQPPFSVQVGGLGAFPTLRRPRVLWVGLRGAQIAPLAQGLEAAVAPLGFAAEARPFQAHITLGRVRGLRGWPQLEPALKAHWADEFGTCVIDEVIAYRSDLRPSGAVYTKLWTIPLEESRRGDPHGSGR